MPGGDGTGPAGMGPMTGRAAGYCAGYGTPGYVNPIPGRGGGWGFGRGGGWGRGRGGWGRRNWFYATGLPGWQRAAQGMPAWGGVPFGAAAPTPEAEKQFLSQQVEALQQQLDAARQRLDELATQESE
ncbi:MAG: DUF5320 domain-containing protein [Phycisphaerae bacterium]